MTEDKIAAGLGEITGLVHGLSDRLDRSDADSRAHRERITERTEDIREAQIRMASAVDNHGARLSAVEASVGVIKTERSKIIGGLIAVGAIVSLFWAGAKYFKSAILSAMGAGE